VISGAVIQPQTQIAKAQQIDGLYFEGVPNERCKNSIKSKGYI